MIRGVDFQPIWFDSMGAKSACVLVESPDLRILIDPGAAIMHPSFPALREEKNRWVEEARRAVKSASRKADVVVISHYHYDHFSPADMELYTGKLLFAKNPNEYINDSQRARAERFFGTLCREFGGRELGTLLERKEKEFLDPMEELKLVKAKDFGDYASRKRELLRKGREWFYKRAGTWDKIMPELKFEELGVRFADGREFRFGGTTLRFTTPLFHGVEYSRVGWVFATVVEYGEEKLIHSSDVNGPIIEDYASWIIEENPDILILDGPMTYMYGYLLNKINLKRAVENACRILRNTKTELILYDHHLLREAKFKERVHKVYEVAGRENKLVLTAAEYLGMTPKVLAKRP